MKNRQLRAIYSTNPGEISSEQALLEQVREFAEIGFNENLKKHIQANKKNIRIFSSAKFDSSKYSQEYLNFLDGIIQALSSAEMNITTRFIREKYGLNQFYSRQPRTKDEYLPFDDIQKDSTLESNVNIRLDAFKKKFEAIRNQQLILQARSLVDLASKDVVENQQNLSLMEGEHVKLCSNYSQESAVKFDKQLDKLFGKKSILSIRNRFVQRKQTMASLLEACDGTPVAEAIRKEQSNLEEQLMKFDLIVGQAAELMNLSKLLKQIKVIEGSVTEKANKLREDTDADTLEEFIQFVGEKEADILLLKRGINGSSEISQQTNKTIEQIEQSIQQKKQHAISLLQKITEKSSAAQQKKEVPPDIPKESSSPSDSKNAEAIKVKKERLEGAINLIKAYRETIENEPNERFAVRFFHKSRNEAKINYCRSLEDKLSNAVKSLNSESDLLGIINDAHGSVMVHGDQADITKGGSYFGTSRMLSLQRLLGINEAWDKKGHSNLLGGSTQFDLHGLKASGVVGKDVRNIVNNFYLVKDNSQVPYLEVKEKAFPTPDRLKPQSN